MKTTGSVFSASSSDYSDCQKCINSGLGGLQHTQAISSQSVNCCSLLEAKERWPKNLNDTSWCPIKLSVREFPSYCTRLQRPTNSNTSDTQTSYNPFQLKIHLNILHKCTHSLRDVCKFYILYLCGRCAKNFGHFRSILGPRIARYFQG